MSRLRLFEFEDQRWLPGGLRACVTDLLRFAWNVLPDMSALAGLVERLLDAQGENRIVDLCSGGSGPWLRLRRLLERRRGRPVDIVLTDRYPDVAAFEWVRSRTGGAVDYVPSPVDARSVPGHLTGARTLFTSLHHFRPDEARAILWDAAVRGQAIGVFEGTERSIAALLTMFLMPLVLVLIAPLVRPCRPGRLLWTYAVPILPVLVMWDGLVSCLRAYPQAGLRRLVAPLNRPGYRWEVGRIRMKRTPFHVTYLLGLPGAAAAELPGEPCGV